MNYTLKITLALLVTLVGTASVEVVFAVTPSWQQDRIDVTAFTNSITVPPLDVQVPTVTDIELARPILGGAVAVDSEGNIGEAVYIRTGILPEVRASAREAVRNLSAIVDNNLTTYAQMPFTEGKENTVLLYLVAPGGMAADEIVLRVMPNVTLPTHVKVSAIPTTGIREVLLARTTLRGNRIPFPETVAQTYEVELTYTQPLRIAELSLVPTKQQDVTHAVRFLAQPGMAHTIYVNPDRAYGDVAWQGMQLETATDIYTYGTLSLQENRSYGPADVDADGVPDSTDNCRKVPNPTQTDVDGNGKGDACDDHDRDGSITIEDNCPNLPNRLQEDTDGDGIGDACDVEESRYTEQNPWVLWLGLLIAVTVLLLLFVLTARGGRPEDEKVDEEGSEKKLEEIDQGQA
jgi:hypothetical protein